MATIKSYTDLPQSKKLAEILPLESADMHYIAQGENQYLYLYTLTHEQRKDYDEDIQYIPCWSLTALLGTLTENKICHYNDRYYCQYINEGSEFPIYSTAEYDNPVDACYEMVLKLHELKML